MSKTLRTTSLLLLGLGGFLSLPDPIRTFPPALHGLWVAEGFNSSSESVYLGEGGGGTLPFMGSTLEWYCSGDELHYRTADEDAGESNYSISDFTLDGDVLTGSPGIRVRTKFIRSHGTYKQRAEFLSKLEARSQDE